MYNYDQIKVDFCVNGKAFIHNPLGLPLIGLGGHGAVFKIDEKRCIKVYPDESIAEPEKNAYLRTIGSKIMPILYEIGERYLIIEYINGPNLKDYLMEKGTMSPHIASQLVNMFHEMDYLHFLRRDESLRHILINHNERIKLVDHYYAFTLHDPLPVKMFIQLKEIGMLETFIKEGFRMSPALFNNFSIQMPEYFTDNIL